MPRLSNRMIRIRGENKRKNDFEVLFPQTSTRNVLRDDSTEILEKSLKLYDRHLGNTLNHVNRAFSQGTANALSVILPGVMLVDNLAILIELHTNLEMEPTLSFNGSPPEQILTSDGNTIPGGQIAGSSILVVWNARHKKWYLLNNDLAASLTHVMIPSIMDYTYVAMSAGENVVVIPGFDHLEMALTVNYNQTELRNHIDYEFITKDTIRLLHFTLEKGDELYFTITQYAEVVKKGSYHYKIEDIQESYVVPENGMTDVPLPFLSEEVYSIIVNYNQTILRRGKDYDYLDAQTIRTNFPLEKGDVVVFTIFRYIEENGILTPMNGARGSYRYQIKVLREEFESQYDEVSKVLVPHYNRLRDELAVILDNHLLIRDVDYAVDELSNVILLTRVLNTGDKIYFTILQGAMQDIQRLNFSDSWGDGKDVKVDISYSELIDFYTLVLRINTTLKDAPTLKLVDGPAEPIVDAAGRPINSENLPGSFLLLVYNKKRECWYCLGGAGEASTAGVPMSGDANFPGQIYIPSEPVQQFAETVIHHGLGVVPKHIRITPCEPPTIKDGVVHNIGEYWAYADENNLYVGNTGTSTSKFHWEISTASLGDTFTVVDKMGVKLEQFANTVENSEKRVQELLKNQKHATLKKVPYIVPDVVPTKFKVRGFDRNTDSLLVNMEQTMLREGIDYYINMDSTISFFRVKLNPGTTLQFIIVKNESEADEEST